MLKVEMKELHEILDEVKDEKSFLNFVRALMKDRETHEGKPVDEVGFEGDWASNDIAGFLESAIAWAEDSDFGIRQDPDLQSNRWKQFAGFLYSGKIYE